MFFRRGTGAARGCLAVALIVGPADWAAGGGTVADRNAGGAIDSGLGSAVHAQIVRQIEALPPAARIVSLRSRAEAGESAVLLALLAKEEGEQALRGSVVAAHAASARDGSADKAMAEAARHGLAAYVAMRTAAPLCSDPTSPDQYLSDLGVALRPVLAWLGRQDAPVRAEVTRAALALDLQLTVPGRPDPMLCRRGQYGDRFCEPDQITPCDDNAAPMAEFTISEARQTHQVRMRRIARSELEALGR